MRSGNPALNESVFRDARFTIEGSPSTAMTVGGTVQKTAMLLVLLLAGAGFAWYQVVNNPQQMMGFIAIGAIGGFILAMITCFKPTAAPYTSPLYALLEGLFLGALSSLFEGMYQGIVIQAVGLTFGTLGALLLAYQSGLIKATENFKLGVTAATGGIALLYLVNIVMGFFGSSIPMIHQSNWLGIGFSAFVVIIAALNLVLDFDFIEKGAEHGAPKYMEWYGAFGLMVTLVWLYLEILRLLSKLNSRD